MRFSLQLPAPFFRSCRHRIVAEMSGVIYIRTMDTSSGANRTPPRCEDCGSYEAQPFDGTWLCGECLQLRGACCAERLDSPEDHSRDARPNCAGPVN